jgi:polysaccharide biosynthesis transport protein
MSTAPEPTPAGNNLPHHASVHEKRIIPQMLEIHRDSGIDFRRILFLLIRHLWIIAIVVTIGMVVLFRIFGNEPRIYESEALIQVATQEEKFLKMDNVVQDSPASADYINTLAQALTSHTILLRVIKANNLENNPNFAPPKAGGGRYSEDQLCAMLEHRYRIYPQKNTRLIQIVARDKDPKMACTLAGSLITEFIRESYKHRSSVSKVANEFLSEEAAKLKEKLQRSEQALQRYKEENQAVSLEQSQNIIVDKLRQLNGIVTAAQDARLKLEADIEQYRRTDPSDTKGMLNIASVANLPSVAELRVKLDASEAELNTLKERYLPLHPKYIEVQSKTTGYRTFLRVALANAGTELQNQYEKAIETQKKMEASLKEQEEKALQLNKLAIQYNVLTRDVESDAALYQSVINRMKETGVKSGEESSPLTVIEEPLVSSTPLPSSTSRYLLIGFILLLFGSIAVVLIIDRVSASIRSVDEAEARFHYPVLGSIPEVKLSAQNSEKDPSTEPGIQELESRSRAKSSKNKKKEEKRDKKGYPVAVVDQPTTSIAESYRTLRTSLMLMDPKVDTSMLMVTSAIPAEGKTYCSVNIAAAFAVLGKKTLLIDADLRRPTIHHAVLEGEVRPGLSDYLGGQATLDEVIITSKIPNLYLITSGNRSPIPGELLAGPQTELMIRELKTRFERVIFDSAPIHAVSDSLILASKVPAVLMVIRTEQTTQHAVARAIHLLHDTGTQIAGLLLNRMKKSGAGYYYYYYYGGKYSDYRTADGSLSDPSGKKTRHS